MKNILYRRSNTEIKLLLKIMKITMFALFMFAGTVFATGSYSQVKRVTVVSNNITMGKVINEIEKQTDYLFVYNVKEVNLNKNIHINARNKTVAEVLNKMFDGTDVGYAMEGKNIMLKKIVDYKSQNINQESKNKISGIIRDVSGAPIIGANVSIKGTSIGTITDMNGKFILEIPNNGILLISYVGYAKQELSTKDQHSFNIILKENSKLLNEVVVVGYGTQKLKDLTGSISHIDMTKREMAPTTDLIQALQGTSPGLNATGGSMAGEVGGLSIRGKTSLSASDTPLLVIDGVIFNGSIGDLNVNDIASVDVLKDASSAAVYGSRSANGVLVVTTKKGSSGKPLFNFSAYYGFQDLSNTDRTHIMNGEQYAERLVDYYYQQSLYTWYKTSPTSADGRPVRPDVTDKTLVASYLRTEEEQKNYLAGNEINWLDEVFRTAPIQSYNLSVSGKTEQSNYYLSSSYTKQEGILVNDNFKKLTLLAKFENKITDWFTLELDPMYTHRDYSGLEASLSNALIASPWGNKYDDTGSYPIYIAGESYAYHPLGHQNVKDSDPVDNINLVFKGKFNIPFIKGLQYEVNYSKDYIFNRHYQYYPTSVAEGAKVNGLGTKNNSTQQKWLINNLITYKHTFNKIHKIDITLLQSNEKLTGEGTIAQGVGFTNEKLGYNSLELAKTQTISSSAYEEYTRSYLGRINYSLNDRYLLTATIRRDGYSGFGSNKKWGSFPSLSLAWVVSEESFLNKVKWLNFLKVRTSYGLNGNQGIGRYKSQSEMSSTSTVFDGSTAIGLYSGSMGNDNLGWEKTKSINIGLDFRILNERINGSFDYYNAVTSDVLVERSIPNISGNSSVWDNIGGIKNHGFEVNLETHNIDAADLKWTSNIAFSLNRNKISKLYGTVTEDIGNNWFVGHSINSIYGYKVEGVWQESDLFSGNILKNYYPGQFKMKDYDGDGQITASGDRRILGSSDPNYRISLNNQFSYKNWSLNIFLNSIQGGDGYYMGENTGALVAGATDDAYRLNRTAVRDYWRPDRPVNNAPGIYYNPKIAPTIYQDKSFIRLQDVTLSYTFGKKALNYCGLTNLRIYMSGHNLYTWTKWSGWDPDVQAPVMRSFIIGINTSF
jgi:TonB-linked SusC/RagA family outer membrane protein